jgi:hypothetical protein
MALDKAHTVPGHASIHRPLMIHPQQPSHGRVIIHPKQSILIYLSMAVSWPTTSLLHSWSKHPIYGCQSQLGTKCSILHAKYNQLHPVGLVMLVLRLAQTKSLSQLKPHPIQSSTIYLSSKSHPTRCTNPSLASPSTFQPYSIYNHTSTSQTICNCCLSHILHCRAGLNQSWLSNPTQTTPGQVSRRSHCMLLYTRKSRPTERILQQTQEQKVTRTPCTK